MNKSMLNSAEQIRNFFRMHFTQKIVVRTFYLATVLLVCFSVRAQTVEAAPSCGAYGGASDPACYTVSTGSWVSESCWWMGPVYDNMYYIQCCWPWGGCRNVYLPWGWQRDGNGYWCGNNHFGTGLSGFNPQSYAGAYYTGDTYTCHYIDSVLAWSPCVSGSQVSTWSHWTTTGGTSCTNVPTTRACCNTPDAAISINGITGSYTVNQNAPFTLSWWMHNPGQTYTCSMSRPWVSENPSGSVPISGSQSDSVSETKSVSGSTPYTYQLDCTGTGTCLPISRTISLYVNPKDYTVDLTVNSCARTGDPTRNGTVTVSITNPNVPVNRYGFKCGSQAWEWKNVNTHVCTFSEPGTYTIETGVQNSLDITFLTKSNPATVTECSCALPSGDFQINSDSTGPVYVDQGALYTLGWSFSNPGESYTCQIRTPSESSLADGTPASVDGGTITDAITSLRSPSTPSTDYEFTLECANSVGVCQPFTKTVSVRVNAPELSVSTGVSHDPAQVGDVVRWSAIVTGGYPPYAYTWTGAEITGATTQYVDRRYAGTGLQTAVLDVLDNVGSFDTASQSVLIQDTRTSQ